MALWSRFFGSAGSQAVGVGLGTTAVPALLPAAQYLVNEAWSKYPTHPLLASILAEGVAQGQVDATWAKGEARLTGIDSGRFDALVAIANVGPGMGAAFELWRRDEIDEPGFRRALKRLGLEPEWIDALVKTKAVLLSPDELANARQQGFITDTRQKAEALLQGIDGERAEIQFELSGLPPGPETMQAAVNRDLADRPTFNQAIREGHTKTKYTDLLFAMRQPILHATDYAGLHLRGWITEAEMNAGGKLSGYTPEQMNLLYLNRGRPIAPQQAFDAIAREAASPTGGVFGWDEFARAIQQSDVRTEYIPTYRKLYWKYPSLFQLRQAFYGGMPEARVRQIMHYQRLEEQDQEFLIDGWKLTRPSQARQTHADKAETQLWSALHRSFVNFESAESTAREGLTILKVPAAEQDTIVNLWTAERDLVDKQLTPTQLRKAWRGNVINPATGVAWTHQEVMDRLVDLGYSTADAETFLEL